MSHAQDLEADLKKSLSTASRRSLVQRRINVMKMVSGWRADFEDVWARLKGRVGGFSDRDVDQVLTNGSVTSMFSESERLRYYGMLRGNPDELYRRVRKPPIFIVIDERSQRVESEAASNAPDDYQARGAAFLEALREPDTAFLEALQAQAVVTNARLLAAQAQDAVTQAAAAHETSAYTVPAYIPATHHAPAAAAESPPWLHRRGRVALRTSRTAITPPSSRSRSPTHRTPLLSRGRTITSTAAIMPVPTASMAPAAASTPTRVVARSVPFSPMRRFPADAPSGLDEFNRTLDDADEIALQRGIALSLAQAQGGSEVLAPDSQAPAPSAEAAAAAAIRGDDDDDSDSDDVIPSDSESDSDIDMADNAELCKICDSRCVKEEMYSVSFCCKHRYCRDCLVGIFFHQTTAKICCPGCKAGEHDPQEQQHPHFVPMEATSLIDPHFVSGIKRIHKRLKNGNQLGAFIKIDSSFRGTGTQLTCPDCKSISIAFTGGEMRRCCRNECGRVFCSRCARPWPADGAHVCKMEVQVVRDEICVDKQSMQCPRCSTAITHNHGHGCHRVTCSSCNHSFCYLCSAMVINGPGGDEMLSRGTCTCSIMCTSTCGCPPCPDCSASKGHCPACDGNCKVCKPK